MKIPTLLFLTLSLLTLSVRAADAPPVVLLWPNGAPGSEGKTSAERVVTARDGERTIFNVNFPSLTVFSRPKIKPPVPG
jgi:endo-1,4-beta-xylanase